MKYLLIAHYAGFDMDDPEDLVNSSWVVGEAVTEDEVIELAKQEIDNYINEQVENRFDLDDEDLDEYEVKNFKDCYETSITNITDPNKLNKMTVVAALYKDGEFYFEDLKVEAIKLGD